MYLLKDLLEEFCSEYGLENMLSETPISEEQVKVLAYRHIDSSLAPFVHGVWVEGNVLVIQCTEPLIMQEFQPRLETMRKEINREAGLSVIAKVRLTLRGMKRLK